ncbi:cupin domain-containing protein [Actinomadura rupiterrae]|uniref:cupin domain-containing protein n=1 Tax=Actinomadura rupiterrae TaxID=559627 RepID=UPI0020A4066D|nr:cupin [Actinomadura rupiterrae]MCP2341822.1 quercetin dioxygenase-like cupin family protein [Actinomadura rupiterrae]
MIVIRAAESRRTTTPNGTMTTLATPTQGGTSTLAVWRVDALPGVTGPLHTFDAEQVWTCVGGAASWTVGDGEHADKVDVAPGDTLVLPAGAPRQMVISPDGFQAVVAAPAGTVVYNPDPAKEDGCELAPKGDERLTPPWVR